MSLFDIKKYSLPTQDEVDMVETRKNIGVFMSAYMSARGRVGQPREPKVTASYSLVPPSTANQTFEAESILIDQEEAQEEFIYLHSLFLTGYEKIQHPFKPDIAMRRKNIFMDRFVRGYSVYVTAQRNNVSEDLVTADTNIIVIQFASALELLVFKNGKI